MLFSSQMGLPVDAVKNALQRDGKDPTVCLSVFEIDYALLKLLTECALVSL
jgi:hypothetical protein